MLDYLGLLADLQQRFHTSIPADLDVAVPTCGEWSIRDLVEHLALMHHWAASHARDVPMEPLAVPADLRGHYATCAAELRTTLDELHPDTIGETLVGPGPVSFWHRRQVHETLIHLYDLRTPLAMGVDGVAAEVWADGVEEVMSMFYPRQVRLGRTQPVPHSVKFVALDTASQWTLGDGEPVATVTAPARELDLFLWGRIGLSQVTIDGDEAKLAATMATALTP